MKNAFFVSTLFLLMALISQPLQAQQAQAMLVSNENDMDETIVDVAVSSDDHTTLVAALKAGGLVETLNSEGPFTVFAPTNAAFEKLPDGTVETLLKPENKDQLVNILTYHVIAGEFNAEAVLGAIEKGNGSVSLETIEGGEITAKVKDGAVYLEDEKGGWAKVTATDLEGSNGVIHVIDTVVMPD